MPRWTPDPTFYATPTDAMRAPPERLAYVALLGTDGVTPDALGVVDTDPASLEYGRLIDQVELPDVSTTWGGMPAARICAPGPPTRTPSAAT
jgi:methanethiol oxidase